MLNDETITRFTSKKDEGGAASAPAQLVVVEGPSRGVVYDIVQDQVKIGRRPDNDLILPSPAVSKYHARIEQEGGRYMIVDVGSTNGVQVNGVRLEANGRRPLCHGDNLAVGDHLLLFRLSGTFADKAGMSTITFDVAKVREEVDALLKDLGSLKRPR